MKWLGNKREKPEVDWPVILKEFESVGKVNEYEAYVKGQLIMDEFADMYYGYDGT